MTKDRRYWDSCAFLGWFNDEPDKARECRSVLDAAGRGEVEIITSAVTLTEVVRVKCEPDTVSKLSVNDEERIKAFFDSEYILISNLDRFVGEKARSLVWKHPTLKPKDALHVASAIISDCPVLDTFDEGLRKLDGQIGNPGLKIGIPHLPAQDEMTGFNSGEG